MGKVKHLALQKYLRLRDKYGHDHATKNMTQQEHDELFNLILINSTPENYDEELDAFIIKE